MKLTLFEILCILKGKVGILRLDSFKIYRGNPCIIRCFWIQQHHFSSSTFLITCLLEETRRYVCSQSMEKSPRQEIINLAAILQKYTPFLKVFSKNLKFWNKQDDFSKLISSCKTHFVWNRMHFKLFFWCTLTK